VTPVATPAPTPAVGSASPVPIAPPVDQTGVGGLGFLILVVLIAAVVGLAFAMRGSLSRLRRREAEGTFGARRGR
jgi:hypothetical protein